MVPAMLRLPIDELVQTLPLREEIRQALTEVDLPEGTLLAWMVRHENADWAACDAIALAHDLDRKSLVRCYAEAVVWAESALNFA